MARQLGSRAKTLILVARRRDRLEALEAELRAAHPSLAVELFTTDLAELDETDALCRQVLDAHGSIDVLINNAGFGDVGLYDLTDWDKMLRMIRVNVEAVALLTHRFLPGMLKQRKGGILNMSSGWGLTFMPGFAAYVGTKHFVTGFTESIRLEARSLGVVVTQVCPGPVDTEFVEVSGNPVGRPIPSFITLSAERCARIALSGFGRGRAMIVPGFLMSLLVKSGMYTPRWLLRLLFTPVGPLFRRRQHEQPA